MDLAPQLAASVAAPNVIAAWIGVLAGMISGALPGTRFPGARDASSPSPATTEIPRSTAASGSV